MPKGADTGPQWHASFETTRWTDLAAAAADDPLRRRQAQEAVLSRYWRPVYAYIRRKDRSQQDAEDLTQAFFLDVVLGRDLLARADRSRGRFRSLLLTALDRFLMDASRRRHAACRDAGRQLRLDGFDGEHRIEPSLDMTPEQAFVHTWAAGIVDEVIAETRDACAARGQADAWEVFAAHCLRPIFEGRPPEPIADIKHRLGLPSVKAAANMAVTIKRKLARALRVRVRSWVGSDQEVEAELSELIEILSGSGAATGEAVRNGG